jgi:hypothetical protein
MSVANTDWLKSIDCCISSLIIFPAVISSWRGTWDIIGLYILPDQTPLNHWVTSAIGCFSLFMGYFIHPPLVKWLRGCRHGVFLVGSRLAMYAHFIFNICLWHGGWGLLDHYMTSDWRWSLIGYMAGSLVSMGLKCFRTNMYTPLSAFLDKKEVVMIPATRFQTEVGICLKILLVKKLLFLISSSQIMQFDKYKYRAKTQCSNLTRLTFFSISRGIVRRPLLM